ncbi:hypothetical protein GCM10027048_27040 [Hymenobacter coalescens]
MRYASICCSLLLLSGFLSRCGKEDPKPASTLRLFVNGAEIQDEQVKAQFVAHRPSYAPPQPGPNDYIRQVAPDTVVFAPGTMRFSVQRTGTLWLFYSVMRTQVPDDNVLAGLLRYSAPVVPVPASTGFLSMSQEVRVGRGEASQLKLAQLRYWLRRATYGGGHREMSGVLANEFNPAVISLLRAGDTLAVQESTITTTVR